MANKGMRWSPGDLFIPGLGMALAIYYLYTVWGLAPPAQLYGGSLSILCILLFLAAAVMVFRHRDAGREPVSGRLKALGVKYSRFVVMAVFTGLFIVIIPLTGYPLASVLFVAATAAFLHYGSLPRILKVSVIVTLVGFVLFILFLKVDLPLDAVSEKIKGVL
ncbi:tripartite tricarboxylate transporter TctB family protein [Aminivibrio sp.]|uniref:tripartite tricarboxylate transporter TctB family protein n=1 Tax=Aminivibrio sp. TaxID=1872489 RepID=UPI001A5D9FBD|nr:tripartite tricarboxylate transporter TctB family protein [Aminivibrio sp.]MBL3539816.1 hypothetical protein [Aminivibrio sp.]